MKKVIAFSLWCQGHNKDNRIWCNKDNDKMKYWSGQKPSLYCIGALKNLELKKKIFKDWIFRYYVDSSVPQNILQKLKDNGAEIIDMSDTKIPGMYWRFLAVDDPNVDICICRDTDSRLIKRDEDAVNDWINNSSKTLHNIRDHPHHKYKIMGGTWGFKNFQKKINLKKLLDIFLKNKNRKYFVRMDDVYFLEKIYELMENDVLCHEIGFRGPFKNSRQFPNETFNGNYYHYIGEYFDENDNNPYCERDTKVFAEFKNIRGKR